MRGIFILAFAGLLNTVTIQASVAQKQKKQISISQTVKKSYNGSDISCRGVSDAEITVTATGGSGVYEYSRDDGATWQSSNILTDLSGGANCIIKVRDANDKSQVSDSKYVWIDDVNAVHINTFQRDTYYNDGSDGVSCVYNSDGAILLKADGGTGAFSYSIDNGATFQSATHFTDLAAGTYNALVKDANGCSISSTSPVTLSAPVPIAGVLKSQTNISCESPNGSITVSGSGGKGNYKTSIDGGQTFYYLAKNKTYTFDNLQAGTYNIIVKDGNYGTGCYGTLPVTIVSDVDQANLNGNPSSPICAGSSASFNLKIASDSKNTFTAVYKNDNGKTYTVNNLVSGDNTITTDALTSSQVFTLVSVTSQGGCQASVTGSADITVVAPGTWLGTNSNWTDGSNWSCGAIPTIATDVTIPATANDPVIPSGISEVNNISIANNASLTVLGTLRIGGAISNDGIFDATNGTLDFDGGSSTTTAAKAQTISGSWFVNKTINNLIISNTEGLSLSSALNDTLNITGILSFGNSNCTFNTNSNLTLKSTANATAGVADITNNGTLKGNSISGNVTVERYVNIGTSAGQHNKTWLMVATPTQGKSIHDTWMEDGDKTVRGYGTQITGKGIGFDATSVAPALKYYSDVTNSWVGVTNTNDLVYNPLGYMLFVRGDRTTTYPNVSNTTLRTTGTLLTGTTSPIKVKAGKFQSIGNPYASAVDIRKISASGINPDIIVWDPTLTIGNLYGMGAYQTLYKDGDNYRNLLPSSTFGPAGTINNNIESGMAFFVQSFDTDGQVYFTENAKTSSVGKGIAMREQTASDGVANLSASLYAVNTDGSSYAADGAIQQFGTKYSNAIDGQDTRKILNSTENLSIISNGQKLVVERRNSLTPEDTINYNLTGISNRKYRFIFNASGIPSSAVNGFIEDNYTKTETPLNSDGETLLDFTVTSNAASKAANRFKIVFKSLRTMPVTFTSVKTDVHNNQVSVKWTVENQSNMKQYEVERSSNGNDFSTVAVIEANNNSSSAYSWLDENPLQGNNYYRIRSVDLNGKISYTSVVKEQISNISVSLKVFPNPATDAKVHIQFNNQPAGVYYARLINPIGQVIVSKKIVHTAGNSVETIEWNKDAARGIYNLQISLPDGSAKVIKIEY
jgi:hypothetical protein